MYIGHRIESLMKGRDVLLVKGRTYFDLDLYVVLTPFCSTGSPVWSGH